MKLTKTRKQIPTIKLSKNLLEDLCKTLDAEFKKVNQKAESEKYGVEYEFSNSNTLVNEKESKLFLENVPIELGRIEMSLESEKGNVTIEFSNSKYFEWNRFSVSGEDSTWVFGITKNLEQVFNRYKTKNYIFHTKKGWGIYLLCAVGLFFSLFIPLNHQITPSDPKEEGVSAGVIAIMLSMTSVWAVWPYIFKRAFPILELENSLQSKLKNLVVVFIIGVISSIIASALFLLAGR